MSWYSQSLAAFALGEGIPAATIDAPRQNFAGGNWFTDGGRAVLFVVEKPVAMDETQILDWQQTHD